MIRFTKFVAAADDTATSGLLRANRKAWAAEETAWAVDAWTWAVEAWACEAWAVEAV